MTATPVRSVAEWIVEFLIARGVDRVYGLQGGHIQPIWDHLAQRNVRDFRRARRRGRQCTWRIATR